MASIQVSADYTDRDLASIRVRFQALIRSVFANWTDFQVANFGNILADLFAFSSDIQGYYLDANAAEAFIPTAVQRRSLLKLAALVGYVPVGASAATTLETFTATGLAANCDIPAGTKLSTLNAANPIEFQTLSDIVLTVAVPTFSVFVENSTTVSGESFTSTGQPNQTIQLGQTPYIDKSLSITAQVGFTEVASFVNSGPSDPVFVVKVDDNDQATVYFGDGVTAGLIPTGTFTAQYKYGGGASGNAAANSIQQIEAPLFDIHGALVQITCNNAGPATGGADRESADAIRQNAPASLTAPAVSVARTDFEIHAKQVPGVDRALYITANEDTSVPLNTGYLYLVAPGANGPGGTGPGSPSGITKDAVRRQFQTDDAAGAPFPMMSTQALTVFEAPFIDVDVTATVYLKKNNLAATVRAAIIANVVALFNTKTVATDGTISDNELIDFAYYLRDQSLSTTPIGFLAASDVENAIRDTVGVREVGPGPADLTLASTQKVFNVTTSMYDSYAGQAAARQDIKIELATASGRPPASNFPRLNSITLLNGDTLTTL